VRLERPLSPRQPVLTGVVRARNAADLIEPLLERLSSIVDDLVVLLDSRSTDGTEQIAKAFATVHRIEFDDHAVESLRSMTRLCTGDWILFIDCDEWLDDSWSREALRELTGDRYATMYWFPRRWIVPPGDRYLSVAPWHPDWQPRLLRNLPTIYRVPDKLHDAAVVAGESRFMPTLPILHNNFLVNDRAYRERTVATYLALNPGNDCARLYLYESSYRESAPLSKRYPNVDRSGIPTVDAPHAADVRILDSPATMRAGESYPIYCSIANRSNRTMTAQSEFLWYADTFLTHHWTRVEGSAQTMYSFGGARHKLPRTIAPGSEAGALIEVQSPTEPGEYLLQLDLFEENVAWFSQTREHGFHQTVPIRAV
jgi:glycosyltransferase involved in cell wall biosynthesis